MIKLRNLDEEVLKYFRKNEPIKPGDLDTSTQNILNTLKNSVADKDGKFIAYDDKEVRDKIKKLEDDEAATRAAIPDLTPYLKKSDMYTKDEIKKNLIHVNDTLKASIDKNTADVKDLRDQLIAKDGKVLITEDFLDHNLLSKILDEDEDTYGALRKEMVGYYGEVRETLRKQNDSIIGLNNNMALCVKFGNLIPESMLPKDLVDLEGNTRTKDVPLSIDDFDTETAKNLRLTLNLNSTKELAALEDIKNNLLKNQGRGNIIFTTTTPEEGRVTCGVAAPILDGVIEACPHRALAYVQNLTQPSPYLDPSTGTTTTIQRPIFDTIADVDDGGKYYTYNERTQKWDESTELTVEAFAGRFLRSSLFHKMYFCYDVTVVDLDDFIHANWNEVTIGANDSDFIPAITALTRNAALIVLDEDQKSRTAGRFINAEGVGTLARSELGYMIFNDDDVPHTFRVVE